MKGVASALVVLALAACGTKTEPTAAPITTTTTTVAPTTTTTVTPDTDAICKANPELTSCGGEGPTKAELADQAKLQRKCANLDEAVDRAAQLAVDALNAGEVALMKFFVNRGDALVKKMKELGC
jgi:hypothetical protein